MGDAALDFNEADHDWAVGKIDFSQDEIPHWKEIALERIKAAKSERLSNIAKEGGMVDISGKFCAENNISQADFDDFCNQVAQLFEVKIRDKNLDLYKITKTYQQKVNLIDIVFPGIIMKGAVDLVEYLYGELKDENPTNE